MSEQDQEKIVVSWVASQLAGMVLAETLRNGGAVEIPSLGIVIRKEQPLKQPPDDAAGSER
jgi:hypothetical protein